MLNSSSFFAAEQQHCNIMRKPPFSEVITLPDYHPKTLRQVNVLFGINMFIFNTGYGIGVTSPIIGQLMGNMLDQGTSSWFASSLVIGQIFGSMLGSLVANRIGRKKGCIISALLSSVGWSVISISQNYFMLILGRILTGFFDCLIVPGAYMYISEVSETKLKGSFLNSTAVASGLGIAFGYLFGCNVLWRYACFAAIFANIIGIVALCFCYESPYYLLMSSQSAMDCLRWYRQLCHGTDDKEDHQEIERELKDIEYEVSAYGQGFRESARKLSQGPNLRAYLIVAALFAFFPLTGVYNISFFAVDLFNKLGLGGAETVAVFTALVRCLGTSCSTLLLLRFGRRVIYLTTSCIVTLIMGSLGVLVFIKDAGFQIDDTLMSWILTVLLILFMFGVGVAVVSFPWILMAEWFSPDLKSLVSTSLITFNFLMIFLAVQTSNMILVHLGTSGLFLYFSGICAMMTLFVAVFVPETQGKTFDNR